MTGRRVGRSHGEPTPWPPPSPRGGIQGGTGGDGGPAPTPGRPGGWQKSSPLTPNTSFPPPATRPLSSRPAISGDLRAVGDTHGRWPVEACAVRVESWPVHGL